jgi:hypothetical protein
VSHPDALPELFLDRSLGRIKVPRLLRDAGLRLVTLAEHYGVPADETVAAGPGLRHSVQCFCLTSQSLSSVETARRFLDNLDAITKACEEEPGPFIFAVHSQRIERLRLDDA